jgi:hypothetical protein
MQVVSILIELTIWGWVSLLPQVARLAPLHILRQMDLPFGLPVSISPNILEEICCRDFSTLLDGGFTVFSILQNYNLLSG